MEFFWKLQHSMKKDIVDNLRKLHKMFRTLQVQVTTSSLGASELKEKVGSQNKGSASGIEVSARVKT